MLEKELPSNQHNDRVALCLLPQPALFASRNNALDSQKHFRTNIMKTKPHTQPSPWLCFRIGRTYRGIFFSEISRKYTKRRIKKGICQIGYTGASFEIYVGSLTSTLLIIIANLSQFFERDAMPWATLAEGPSTDPSLGLTLGAGLPAFWAGPGHQTSNAKTDAPNM